MNSARYNEVKRNFLSWIFWNNSINTTFKGSGRGRRGCWPSKFSFIQLKGIGWEFSNIYFFLCLFWIIQTLFIESSYNFNKIIKFQGYLICFFEQQETCQPWMVQYIVNENEIFFLQLLQTILWKTFIKRGEQNICVLQEDRVKIS